MRLRIIHSGASGPCDCDLLRTEGSLLKVQGPHRTYLIDLRHGEIEAWRSGAVWRLESVVAPNAIVPTPIFKRT